MKIDGAETHVIVTEENDLYFGLDNSETRDFCKAGKHSSNRLPSRTWTIWRNVIDQLIIQYPMVSIVIAGLDTKDQV